MFAFQTQMSIHVSIFLNPVKVWAGKNRRFANQGHNRCNVHPLSLSTRADFGPLFIFSPVVGLTCFDRVTRI